MAGRHIVCPHCDAINRIPPARPAAEARCGKCHRALFTGEPIALDAARFETHISRNDIPVLVDFWAQWCGPCKAMAPVFRQAAATLEPEVRLVKVDTDKEQQLAGRYAIRGIPTLILFHKGAERARTAGAQNLAHLLDWVRPHL